MGVYLGEELLNIGACKIKRQEDEVDCLILTFEPVEDILPKNAAIAELHTNVSVQPPEQVSAVRTIAHKEQDDGVALQKGWWHGQLLHGSVRSRRSHQWSGWV